MNKDIKQLAEETLKKHVGNDTMPVKKVNILSAMVEMYTAGAREATEEILEELGEKEVMCAAFDKVRQLFEQRSWIMEGRGSYPFNDDRYKEEVRYLYNEFDQLQKDTWKNIKTKTFEYRAKIIADYLKASNSVATTTPLSSSSDDSIEQEDIYDSIYMEVVQLVEKDNIQCEAYKATAEKLKSQFVIKRKQ